MIYTIQTTSTGGNDASIRVIYNGTTTNIIYTSVKSTPLVINNDIEISYRYYTGTNWCIKALTDTYKNNIRYINGDIVDNWTYNTSVNYSISSYHFIENLILEDNPLSFELQDNVSLQANFELVGYQVTTQINPSGYGTTTGDGYYAQGSSVTLNAQPNTGYKFVNWTLNNVEVSTNPTYTFTMGSSDVTYVANFVVREWINCIYDRTQEDIEQRTSKAFINVNDWNRIENNLDFLSVRYQTTNVSRYWSYTDIPTNQKISTLLSKLNVLKAKVSESPSLPTTILNYTQVNQIEYFLYFMFDYYFNRIQIISQPISGFYNANEPNVLMATRP